MVRLNRVEPFMSSAITVHQPAELETDTGARLSMVTYDSLCQHNPE